MTDWLRHAGRPFKPALNLLRSYMIAPLAADLGGLSARLEQIGAAREGAINPAQTSAPTPPAAAAAGPIDMNLLLHRGRTALLREVPKGAEVFLSAGCAGSWFFEWVQKCYGDIPRHIGLEYYVPRPDTLPANVEWIANTCSDMSGVADRSCDLVFSGQNLEHLWTDEAVGFFLEAARVTRPGGLLVMDSPNRGITEVLRTWVHPEHTVELTTAEAVEVTGMAGFDVAAVKGIWLGRDPNTGTVLPFEHADGLPLSLEERLIGGVGQPDHAFLWWIEARRADREPDGAALRHRLTDIFRTAWPERASRSIVGVGRVETGPDGEWVVCPPATSGPLIFGPYMPLRPGRYRCTFELEAETNGMEARARCDVAAGESGTVLMWRDLHVGAARETVSFEFELAALQFGLQFRCYSLGGSGFRCRRVVRFEELGPTAIIAA